METAPPTATSDHTPRRVSGLTIPFSGRARIYRCEQVLATPRADLFPFFADARNLQEITPPFLNFRVLTEGPIDMRPGAIIEYKLRVRFLPIRWRTEITAWEPDDRFVDVQRRGPYRLWHHEHTFEPLADDSTRCVDVVHYAHWGGPLIEKFFVRPDIETIFEYRRKKLAERFGEVDGVDKTGSETARHPVHARAERREPALTA